MSGNFYDELKPIATLEASFEAVHYAGAPEDWWLAVSDIKGSTQAVAEGRHADVNFAAAAVIAALVNALGSLPYQFTGDGAVVLIPPAGVAQAKRVLARIRGFAQREMALALRVGLVALADLRVLGADLKVGRYQPSPGNNYAQFLGDAVQILEDALKEKGHPELAQRAAILPEQDDGEPPDLTGLSCRWNPLQAVRGRIVTLVIRTAGEPLPPARLLEMVGIDALTVARPDSLSLRWPPKRLLLEARARHGGRQLVRSFLIILIETLLMAISIRWGLTIGGFQPRRYQDELLTNLIDFSRSGDCFNIVFDCPADRITPLKNQLKEAARRGELKFGMHVADFAVMTCLVRSVEEGQHVHFVDGGDGGYTAAAIALKRYSLAP